MRAAIWIGATAVVAGLAMPAAARERSPRASGVYNLIPGLYVASDARCADPPNAVIRLYDGRGISGAHSRACIAKVLSRKGATYRVNQSCIDAGAGPAPRSSERQTVQVLSPRGFVQGASGSSTTYRYCAPRQLPPELRSAIPR